MILRSSLPRCLGLHLWGALFLLSVSVICLAGPGQEQSAGARRLVFGVYAYIRSTELLKKMEPFQRHLQRSLGDLGVDADISLRVFPTYGEAIDALVEGQVDFVRFGPVSYVLAKQRSPSIRLLAMESNEGRKSFDGVLSVPLDSPVHSVEDLRGKRIAFGDRRSTTGRFLAQAALVSAGIRAKDLAGYTYLGRHDKVAFAVASGNYDAGATNENTFFKYAREKKLRKILSFSSVTKPWVARAGLDETVFQALRSSLLALRDPSVLAGVTRSGFLPASDADYDSIRQAMALAGKFDEGGTVFGVYTSEMPSEMYRMVRPVLDRLQERLAAEGLIESFRIRVFQTYRAAIDALVRGDVDFGRFGLASYCLADAMNPHLRPLAMEDADEAPSGLFIVRTDSSITSLHDLADRSFAFGGHYSTEGRYLAQVELLNAGLHGVDLKTYRYLGRHDRVAFAVEAGKYDAGVVRDSVFAKSPVADRLRIIGRFPAPNTVWVARSTMEDELFEGLQRSLLALTDDDALAGLGIRGFAEVDSAALEPVIEAILRAPEFEQPQ